MKLDLKSIEKFYKENFDNLGSKQFHFASRLFLWKKDEFCEKKLQELMKDYIGETENETNKILKKTFEEKVNLNIIKNKDLRAPFLKKYPELRKYTKILFKCLFSQTIYQKNIRKNIRRLISDKFLLELKDKLESDEQAMMALSTYAINYFYMLAFYLEDESILNVNKYFKIALCCFKKSKENNEFLSLGLYLLTHCIIGKSNFYSRLVNGAIYMEMLLIAEKTIKENFEKISLDNKFEFLVCTQLLEYESSLRELIYEQTRRNISDSGYFILNGLEQEREKNYSFVTAEHRNVLAIMSSSKNTLDK